MTDQASSYIRGLMEAQRLIKEEHYRLRQEYDRTPRVFFGLLLSSRHHEIIAASEALVRVGWRLANESEISVSRLKAELGL